MTKMENNSLEAPRDVELSFAEALLFAKSGMDARLLADGALVQLAQERPEFRYDIYKKVSYQNKRIIGPLLTIEEAAFRLAERPASKPFTLALCKWIESCTQGEMLTMAFRSRDLDQAGCVRLNRDAHLCELRALGMITNASEKWHNHLTRRGVDVYRALEQLSPRAT